MESNLTREEKILLIKLIVKNNMVISASDLESKINLSYGIIRRLLNDVPDVSHKSFINDKGVSFNIFYVYELTEKKIKLIKERHKGRVLENANN